MIPLLTPAEAAGILRVSTKTLQRLAKAGLRSVRVGRSIRYRPDDLAQFLEAAACHTAPKTRASGTTISKSGVVDFMAHAAPKISRKPRP